MAVSAAAGRLCCCVLLCFFSETVKPRSVFYTDFMVRGWLKQKRPGMAKASINPKCEAGQSTPGLTKTKGRKGVQEPAWTAKILAL